MTHGAIGHGLLSSGPVPWVVQVAQRHFGHADCFVFRFEEVIASHGTSKTKDH